MYGDSKSVLVETYHQEAVPEVAVLYAADEGCHFLQRTVYETSAHEAVWEQPTIANSIRTVGTTVHKCLLVCIPLHKFEKFYSNVMLVSNKR